jgi:hypothetical protein
MLSPTQATAETFLQLAWSHPTLYIQCGIAITILDTARRPAFHFKEGVSETASSGVAGVRSHGLSLCL